MSLFGREDEQSVEEVKKALEYRNVHRPKIVSQLITDIKAERAEALKLLAVRKTKIAKLESKVGAEEKKALIENLLANGQYRRNSFEYISHGLEKLEKPVNFSKFKSFIRTTFEPGEMEKVKLNYMARVAPNLKDAEKSDQYKEIFIKQTNKSRQFIAKMEEFVDLHGQAKKFSHEFENLTAKQLLEKISKQGEVNDTRIACKNEFLERIKKLTDWSRKNDTTSSTNNLLAGSEKTKKNLQFSGILEHQQYAKVRGIKLDDEEERNETKSNSTSSNINKSMMTYFLHFDGQRLARILNFKTLQNEANVSNKSLSPQSPSGLKAHERWQAQQNSMANYAGLERDEEVLARTKLNGISMANICFRDNELLKRQNNVETSGEVRQMFSNNFWHGVSGERRYEAIWNELGGNMFDKALIDSGQVENVKSDFYRASLIKGRH